VGLFRRGARTRDADRTAGVADVDDVTDAAEDAELDGLEVDANGVDAGSEPTEPTEPMVRPGKGGPWDAADVDSIGARVNLGAIWLPGVTGMELRMEIDKATSQVTAVAINLAGSALQVQAFAAPRTEGIWAEIRAEIAASVTKQGGSADDLPGPFGRELLARLPVRTAEGRTGHRPARFIGHDGPRWFLRGVLTGKAAVDPESARALEEIFADIVVIRGSAARAPRDLLALALPAQPGAAPVQATGAAATQEPAAPSAPPLDPLTRGPEITEIH